MVACKGWCLSEEKSFWASAAGAAPGGAGAAPGQGCVAGVVWPKHSEHVCVFVRVHRAGTMGDKAEHGQRG